MIDSVFFHNGDRGNTPKVIGWENVSNVLIAQDLLSDPWLAGATSEPSNNMLLMDGQHHQTLRRLIIGFLSRPAMAVIATTLEERASVLVDCLRDSKDCDLITDLAEPLVLEAILMAMGVAPAHWPTISIFAREMLGMLEPDLSKADRLRSMNAALRTAIFFQREALAGRPSDISSVLQTAVQDGSIPAKLARSTPAVILHGGYENPLNQLGCVLAWAVNNPTLFHSAAARAPLVLFEEILRISNPVRLVARRATAEGDQNGRSLKRGDLVWVDLESANLDPYAFDNPLDFNSDRKRRHLGFGHGRHKCPGAGLARQQGVALIKALLTIPPQQLSGFSVLWREGTVAIGPATIKRR